jgi:hypothetical protein
MAQINPLLLQCDVVNSKFTLAREGEAWRRSFDSFEDAYEEAELRANDSTPLILSNPHGRVIAQITVSPLSAELANRRVPLPVKSVSAD